MSKSQASQSESHRPGGPGLKYKPTSSPTAKSAKIGSKALGTGSSQSHMRGKQG